MIPHPERITLHTRRGGTWCWRKGAAIVIATAALVFIICMGVA